MARARRLGGELRTLREGPLPTRSSRCSQEPPWNMEGVLRCADRLAALKKDAPLMGSACPSDAASHIFGCRIKGNQRSKKYHHPGCPAYDSISAKNVAKLFCSEDEARAEGYIKAGNCPP